MGVDVHEPGGHEAAVGVEHAARVRGGALSGVEDGADDSVVDLEVGESCPSAGAVHEACIAHEKVDHALSPAHGPGA